MWVFPTANSTMASNKFWIETEVNEIMDKNPSSEKVEVIIS